MWRSKRVRRNSDLGNNCIAEKREGRKIGAWARRTILTMLAVLAAGAGALPNGSTPSPVATANRAAILGFPFDVALLSAVPMSDRVLLTWKNPSAASLAGTLIVYRMDRFPVDSNDGQLAADLPAVPNTSGSYVHTGLVTKADYYYTVFSYDGSRQVSGGVQAEARTSFSYLAPKGAREPCCQAEYPYLVRQRLSDGVYGSDCPCDPAWVEFSQANVNPYFFSVVTYDGLSPSLVPATQEIGAQVYRHQVTWSQMETAKGTYNWANLDAKLTRAASIGLQPYFLLMDAPLWAARGGGWQPPDRLEDYADFAVALVKHVNAAFPNGTTKTIEVWNEINENFWNSTIDTYLQMLKVTYMAVKAEDPSWRIMAETFSGLQVSEFDYLYSFKNEDGLSILKMYSDLIAVHPYGGILGPDDPATYGWDSFALLADNTHRLKNSKVAGTPWSWGGFEFIDENDPSTNILRSWRQVMIKNGDVDKKLWLTEVGWSRKLFDGSDSRWHYAPDPKRVAELVSRLYEKSFEYDFVENVSYYRLWPNCGDEPTGLVDVCNGVAKTNAYYAFQNLATTDGIVIDLDKSPTDFYPAPLLDIKGVKVGALNYTLDGQPVYKIQKIDVSISSDNITYTPVGQIVNAGPNSGRVNLKLEKISQIGRWIKLQITPEPWTYDYLIDEVDVEVGP